MGSTQPFIEHLCVDAAWDGKLSNAVDLKISVDVVATSGSQLSLIRNSHPSVLSTQFAAIPKLPQKDGDISPVDPSKHHHSLQQEAFSSPLLFPHTTHSEAGKQGTSLLHEVGFAGIVMDPEIRRSVATVQSTDNIHSVSDAQQKSSAGTAGIPLFAQTASLYEAASSRDSALSPPLPPTLQNLTISKRASLEPESSFTSNRLSPVKQTLTHRDDVSHHVLRKRPVSLDKRPPWRPVGAECSSQRGRRQLGTDVGRRRISKSAGTQQVHRGRTRYRQSSLPGRVRKTEKGSQGLQATQRNKEPQTHKRGRLARGRMRTGLRDRDTTVKITRYVETLNANERLEKWLDDRQSDWLADDPPFSELLSDDERPSCLPDSCDSSGPALSPSPTPSSRAALPWTSIRGIRGGGSANKTHSDLGGEAPIPTLIEDNGTTFARFHGYSTEKSEAGKFRIEIYASIKLEAHRSGCHSLAIPGLPLQSGNAEGTFRLTVMGDPSSVKDRFEAHEKVAYVDDDISTHPLKHERMSHSFRLDTPFNVKLLCFEMCRLLEPTDFEVESDVYTRYEWENWEGDDLSAENSMICSLRLHPFLMWAEDVKFKLYLIGGPSGTLETSLDPGNRRIYLEGKRCDAEHELEISLTCKVAELQKTFIISWEQSLGVAPFQIWLPRISGLHRKKLEELFDLPHGRSVSLTPGPCRRSRLYSMVAQEEFLKASGEIFFFPENQHTPRTIRQSLSEQSGQFYEELTAEYDVSAPSSSTVSGACVTPLEQSSSLNPNKGRGNGIISLLRGLPTDPSGRPTVREELNEDAGTSVPASDATKATQATSTEALHHPPKSLLAQSFFWTLGMLYWFIGRLAAPARLVKVLVWIWLCFRAFEHDTMVQLESSVMSKAIDAWSRWDLEPVQLRGDFTGWKHLMAKVNQGAARVIHDGHIGVLSSINRQPEKVMEGSDGVSVMSEDGVVEDTSGVEQPVLVGGGLNGRTLSSLESNDQEAEALTLLDRIDLALGWRPPTGVW